MGKQEALSWEEPLGTRISHQFHRLHLERVTHVHIRIHHWVLWWIYVGVVCGVVALGNILFRDLTRTEEKVILAVGVLHWLLGGLVCYACEGIQVQEPPPPPGNTLTASTVEEKEWYPASYFVLPGRGGKFLPPK